MEESSVSFINNSWVVGIVGGVFSGVLVLIISGVFRFFFKKKQTKEYTQRVMVANQEVLYAIRPGISEQMIPDDDVVDKLISTISKSYGVDRADMNSISDISAELIREVMSSYFLSANAKKAYCKDLLEVASRQEKKVKVSEENKRETKAKDFLPGVLTILAGVTTGFVAFFGTVSTSVVDVLSSGLIIKSMLVLSLATVGILLSATVIIETSRKRKIERLYKNYSSAILRSRQFKEDNKAGEPL